jgi:LPS export ABC transporter protein LptC
MMKAGRKRSLVVSLLSAVVIAGIALTLWINIRNEPEKAVLKIMSDKVDLQVRNVRFTEVGDSGMKWEITAESARYEKKENRAFFEKLSVRLLTKDGETFIMTGDRGEYNTASQDMQIEGHVVIVSDNGDRFTTERLRYRNAEKLIETDLPVVMENRMVRISGLGMVLSIDEKKVTLLSEIVGRYGGRPRGAK